MPMTIIHIGKLNQHLIYLPLWTTECPMNNHRITGIIVRTHKGISHMFKVVQEVGCR